MFFGKFNRKDKRGRGLGVSVGGQALRGRQPGPDSMYHTDVHYTTVSKHSDSKAQRCAMSGAVGISTYEG